MYQTVEMYLFTWTGSRAVGEKVGFKLVKETLLTVACEEVNK